MSEFDVSEKARSRELSVLFVVTGTLASAHLPYWLNWLEVNRPHYSVTIAMTDAARNFVSDTALEAISGRPIVRNQWSEGEGPGKAVHVHLADDFDAVVVFPASTNFLTSLAAASGANPIHLALLGVRCPVVLAPCFPPHVSENPLVKDAIRRVASVPNYRIVAPQAGKSRTTGEETFVTAALWDVISELEMAVESQEKTQNSSR